MQIQVARPNELGPAEVNQWATLHRANGRSPNPFLSFIFARVVDANREGARVAVIEDTSGISAFFPFEIVGRREGVPIGSPMNDHAGFISNDKTIDPRLVVRQAGLRSWRFDHVPEDQSLLRPYFAAMGQSLIVDLTHGFDWYLTKLASRSKIANEATQYRRRLEREFGPVRLEWHSPTTQHFFQIIRWKTEQYQRTGVSVLFDDPTVIGILEQLVSADTDECTGVVHAMFAGDHMIAGEISLRGSRTLCSWFPAYDVEFGKYSPGTVMTMEVLREACTVGIRKLDLGAGREGYKRRWAEDFYLLGMGTLYASRLEALGRALYRRLRDSLPTRLLLSALPRSHCGLDLY
jgi:CelD/BcsL family acetyltransferase involved in cellulose biosynthesis